MEIGLFAPLGNGNATADVLRTLGREAEDRGFESVWVAEHVVLFDDYESQYPYAMDPSFRDYGSRGRPSTRSPRMFLFTSVVPPAMLSERDDRRA